MFRLAICSSSGSQVWFLLQSGKSSCGSGWRQRFFKNITADTSLINRAPIYISVIPSIPSLISYLSSTLATTLWAMQAEKEITDPTKTSFAIMTSGVTSGLLLLGNVKQKYIGIYIQKKHDSRMIPIHHGRTEKRFDHGKKRLKFLGPLSLSWCRYL